jgi:hypothetical protein
VIAVLLVEPAGWPAGSTNSTAITKLRPDAATAVVVAPDDGHEDARNMYSCIK